MRPVEIARQRLMEDRHQRRALPAGGDIGGAEIIGHRQPQPLAPAPRRRRSAPSVWQPACAARSGRESRQSAMPARSICSVSRKASTVSAWTRVTKSSACASTPGRAVAVASTLRPRQAPDAAAPARQSRIRPVADRPEGGNARRHRSRSAPHRRRRARSRSSARWP